jgi:hypothetical protein
MKMGPSKFYKVVCVYIYIYMAFIKYVIESSKSYAQICKCVLS